MEVDDVFLRSLRPEVLDQIAGHLRWDPVVST
jgi:hypothetical protein